MQLRHPDYETADPRLDYIPQIDSRNKDFPLTAVLNVEELSKSKQWRPGLTLDQGPDGACVGAALTHLVASQPSGYAKPLTNYFDDVMNDFARGNVYWSAQRVDLWPGGEYPGATPRMAGTSLLAGLKVMRDAGWFETFHWAWTSEQVAAAVVNIGPVLLGTKWYEGMMDPDGNGQIKPDGQTLGGHCVAITGFNKPKNRFTILNSWGTEWGVNGSAYLSARNLDRLMKNGGEVAVPTGRATAA